MDKLDLEKAGVTRDQIAKIHWIIEKARELKHEADEETSASLTMLKSLTMWITTNWKIILKR